MAPTKALLNNQAGRLHRYAEMVGLTSFVWHGDVGSHERRRFQQEPAALLLTTPESLEVMLASERVDEAALFSDTGVVIVDEVHALCGTDRGAHLMCVLDRLQRLSRHDIQRVGLSATVGNPSEILSWLQGSSCRPGRVIDPARAHHRRQLLVLHRPDLSELASDAAEVARGRKSLLFCQSRAAVEPVAVPTRCWPVLIHQLLAMALAEGGVPPDEAWSQLSLVPDLRGISRVEYDRLLEWMLRDRSFALLDGRLQLGPKAERLFGRRNFMELYSVFSSPQVYSVEALSGAPLGTLGQGFVDRLAEGHSCFRLGGRPWSVREIHHGERRIRVEPAPRGQVPTWGGSLPQFLNDELCQAILEVLTSEADYPYLHPTARLLLAERRSLLGDLLRSPLDAVEMNEEGELRWWTFAGGRINGTLRYALHALNPSWKIIPDNFCLQIRADGIDREKLGVARARLADADFWADDCLWRSISVGLPNFRLSKFQPLMPPWVEREVLSAWLLDGPGTARWLSGAR